jgi:hypothetical protein
MKQKFTFLLLALLSTTAFAQVKLKHGLLLGGGAGTVNYLKYTAGDDLWNGERTFDGFFTDYKYSGMLGYKFRIKPLNRKTFFDIDLIASTKRIDYSVSSKPVGEQPRDNFYIVDEDYTYNSASLALGYNYQTYKGLYVGAGIEPLYCYQRMGTMTFNKFDMPVFVKIGYELKFIDISVSCKKGITDMLKDEYVKNGRINDLQIQMFIPF